jgi:hypothetical protein
MTWGEFKKDVDKELENDAEIKEIRVTELYYRGVETYFDRARNVYVITNKVED